MSESRVYFIRKGGLGTIKIGFSENVSERLSGLRVKHDEPLNLLATIAGGRPKEKELHERFEAFRTEADNEWHKPDRELLAFIEGILEGQKDEPSTEVIETLGGKRVKRAPIVDFRLDVAKEVYHRMLKK